MSDAQTTRKIFGFGTTCLAVLSLVSTYRRLQSFTTSSVAYDPSPQESGPRVAVFMTTHQSDEQMAFLSKCWISDSHRLQLLRNADLIYYSSGDKIPYEILNQTAFRKVIVYRYTEEQVLSVNSTFHQRNEKKQKGAKRAMVEPYLSHWFDEYDWYVQNVFRSMLSFVAVLTLPAPLSKHRGQTDEPGLCASTQMYSFATTSGSLNK
jgi:hypothetical protein